MKKKQSKLTLLTRNFKNCNQTVTERRSVKKFFALNTFNFGTPYISSTLK